MGRSEIFMKLDSSSGIPSSEFLLPEAVNELQFTQIIHPLPPGWRCNVVVLLLFVSEVVVVG